MPIQIQDAGPTAALRRMFRFTGRLVPRLDETISPVAVVTDSSRELPPGVVGSACAERVQAAVAGEQAGVRFEIPPATLAVVKKVSLGIAGGAAPVRVAFGSQLAAPFTLGPSVYTDGRLRGNNAVPAFREPSGRMSRNSQVAGIVAQTILSGGPSQNDMRDHEVFWPVGGLAGLFDFLEFQSTVANAAFRVCLEWEEFANVTTTL